MGQNWMHRGYFEMLTTALGYRFIITWPAVIQDVLPGYNNAFFRLFVKSSTVVIEHRNSGQGDRKVFKGLQVSTSRDRTFYLSAGGDDEDDQRRLVGFVLLQAGPTVQMIVSSRKAREPSQILRSTYSNSMSRARNGRSLNLALSSRFVLGRDRSDGS